MSKGFSGLYFPRIARAQKFREVAFAALRLHFPNLIGNHIFVARNIFPRSQDAHRGGEAGQLFHVREKECVHGPRVVLVVNEQVALGDSVAKLDDFEVEAVHADALIAILAEDQRFAVFELDNVLAARVFFRDRIPGVVIEDIAVLQNLNVSRALVRGGLPQCFFQVLLENVHRARDERGAGADARAQED